MTDDIKDAPAAQAGMEVEQEEFMQTGSAAGQTDAARAADVDESPVAAQGEVRGQAASPEMMASDEAAGAPAPGAGGAAIEKLPVEIEFHLGQITLPAGELQQLAQGRILSDLPGLLFPRAEIRSAGRVFAEGELVEVGGRTGFRITRILD